MAAKKDSKTASAATKKPAEKVVDSVTPQERAFPSGFVTVTKGDHKDVYGVIVDVFADEKGEPDTALIRSRDADHALLSVNYADLEPAESGGR